MPFALEKDRGPEGKGRASHKEGMIGARGMHRFCFNKQASEGGEPCACSCNYKDAVSRTYDEAVEVLCSRMQIGVKRTVQIAGATLAGGVRLAIAQESGEGEERTERKERKEARERAYLVGVAAGASFGACPALQ